MRTVVQDLLALAPAERARPSVPPPATLEMIETWRADPLGVGDFARDLTRQVQQAAADPATLLALAARWGVRADRPHLALPDRAMRAPTLPPCVPPPGDLPTDALRASLQRLACLAAPGTTWQPEVPGPVQLPPPLRGALAEMVDALAQAERLRRLALQALPPDLAPTHLWPQLIDGTPAAEPRHDLRRLLPQLNTAPLTDGLQRLARATQRLEQVLRSGTWPTLDWRLETPLGELRVDTTGRDGHHVLRDPLLVVNLGGNDRYTFTTAGRRGRVTVLLDLAGDDTYEARDPGADPSGAVLGIGLLWDAQGHDRHVGTWFAQGSALLGAALLVDGAGDDRYQAIGHAQGHAFGGMAGLLDRGGHDHYHALTHAQGSAGPNAVGLLVDVSGHDTYELGNTPLVRPSAQARERNVSMGQGAGRGLRPAPRHPGMPGGFGGLFDLGGHDRYRAQVFAQGVGFEHGLGLLADTAGDDAFTAAWYGMGAGAHGGIGVLLGLGNGDDHYTAELVTSMAAAHDGAIAWFVDEGGRDRYRLGELGLGAAHGSGVAVFLDLGGADRYITAGAVCRSFGAAVPDPQAPATEPQTPRIALFADLDGQNQYQGPCVQAGAARRWQTPSPAAAAPHVGIGVDDPTARRWRAFSSEDTSPGEVGSAP